MKTASGSNSILREAEVVAAPKLAVVETAAAFYRRVRKGSLSIRQGRCSRSGLD
jgi:hypothetical protein